jgi:hypothetical protein
MARNDDAAVEKKQNWFKQVWTAYKITRQTDPSVALWTLGPFLGIILVAVLIGLLTPIGLFFPLMLGIPGGFIVGLLMLVKRAEAAAYKRLAGQPGAALSAVGTVRTGNWTWEQEPVAFNPKTGEMVFRGVGRGGVVLVSEGGSDHRAAKLADGEVKRVKRVVQEAPVTIIRVGEGEERIPLTKLSRHVTKMKPVLSKTETADVTRRLKTLGAKKPLPIPKGVDPFNTRPDRRGVRGR